MTTMPITQEMAQQIVGELVGLARVNGGKWDIRDMATGAIVASVIAHDLPVRPKDMPRHLRPKRKLSKRQRQAAKHAKSLLPV